MRYLDFLLSIAAVLGDDRPGHEFTRYSVGYLSRAVHQGLIIASKERPDLFTELAVFKLRAGVFQDARAEFDELFEVIAQTSESGQVLRHLAGSRPSANTAKSAWTKASCLAAPCHAEFMLASAALDGLTPGRFIVAPAVPPGAEIFVLMRGLKYPKALSEADLEHDLKWDELLYAVVPYYAFAMAALSDKDDAAHQRHVTMFYQMLRRAFDSKVAIQETARPDDVSAKG